MIKRLNDVHMFRGEAAGMFDFFLVERKFKMRKEWKNMVEACRRKVVEMEELNRIKKRRGVPGANKN